MFVAFMLKHTILVECKARLFEVEFKFHLNLVWIWKLEIEKDLIMEKLSFLSSSRTLGVA